MPPGCGFYQVSNRDVEMAVCNIISTDMVSFSKKYRVERPLQHLKGVEDVITDL